MKKKDLVLFRAFRKSDSSFLIDSFLKSYQLRGMALMSSEIYFKVYSKYILDLIENTDTVITIICFKEEPDIIYGYSIQTETNELKKENSIFLHFLFVKFKFRKMGLGKLLFDKNFKDKSLIYTDIIPTFFNYRNKKIELFGSEIIFKPLLGILK